MSDEDERGDLVVEGGPFAIVPETVLVDLGLSDGAVRLYGALAIHANREGASWPRRRTLATRLGVSVKTVDRRVDELVGAGLLTVRGRADATGRQTSNLWTLRVHRGTRMTREGVTSVPPGGVTDDAPGTRPRGTRYDEGQKREPQRPGPVNPTRTAAEIAAELDAVEPAPPEVAADALADARRAIGRPR